MLTSYSLWALTAVGSTELSLVSGTSTLQTLTDQGIVFVKVDTVNLAKSDYFKVRVYEKVLSTSTKRVVMQTVIGNAQTGDGGLWLFPGLLLRHGWDVTIQKVAGADCDIAVQVSIITCPINEIYAQTALSVSTTELSLTGGTSTIQNRTSPGMVQAFIDTSNMAKADEFLVRAREAVYVAQTARYIYSASLMDVQSESFFTPPFPMCNGWDITMDRISGADRTFDVSIRQVT